MRGAFNGLRSPFGRWHSSTSVLSIYAVLGLIPKLVLDFEKEFYVVNNVQSTLAAATTHTRASNATMVDSDGLLKWAPHNLQLHSENFTNSNWGAVNCSKTIGVDDPDGGTSAVTIVPSGNLAYLGNSFNSVQVPNFVQECWLRSTDGEPLTLTFRTATSLGGTADLTSEWQLFNSGSFTASGSDFRIQNRVDTRPFDVAFPRIYRSDLGGMVNNPATGDSYVPTTDAAVYLPRTGHHIYNINSGVTTGGNLVLNGTFDDDSAWALTGGSIAGGSYTGPSSGAQGVQQNNPSLVGGGLYLVTFTANVAASVTTGYLRIGSNATAASSTVDTTPTTYSRIVTAGNLNDLIFLLAGNANSLTLDDISVLKINPWVNEGLLLESEARTNLLTYSNEFDNASWARVSAASPTGDAVGPDGLTNSAYTLVDNSAGGTGNVGLQVAVSLPINKAHTYSVYLKADQLGFASLQTVGFTTPANGLVWFDLTSGTVGTQDAGLVGGIEAVGGGWFRCSVTFTTDVSDTTGSLRIRPATADNVSLVDLDGTSSILIYGAQLEEGSTPSSPIPTSGAAATRAAETLVVPAANMPTYTDAVSIAVKGKMTYADGDTSTNVSFHDWAVNGSNQIKTTLSTVGSATGQILFYQAALGVVDNVNTGPSVYSPSINVPYKIASRHGSTFINGATNGTALTANTTPTAIADLSATDFVLGKTFMGTISELRVWPVDITDAGIEEASA